MRNQRTDPQAEPVGFDGDRVFVGSRSWRAPARVLDSVRVGDLVVLVLDSVRVGDLVVLVLDWTPLADGRVGQHNLRAYALGGREVWVAEHPTHGSNDCYTEIHSRSPLIVGNFAGFRCEIEPETGRLVEAVFTK